MTGYWFFGDRLRDGRAIPPDGEWLVHNGNVELCESGLHASRAAFDALQYAPGSNLALVECEDIVQEDGDKIVCRRRKIIRRIDATELLRRFAREEALSVIHLWDAPEVVRRFLETGDKSLRAKAVAATFAWKAGATSAEAVAARTTSAMAARAAATWAMAVAMATTARRAAGWAAEARGVEARSEAEAARTSSANRFNAIVEEAFKELGGIV